MTPEPESDPKLQIAHVLAMDVVEYSTLLFEKLANQIVPPDA